MRRLLVLLALALLMGGSAADARHRATDRIAFASNRDGPSYEIYVMNADGSGQTRLTSNGVEDFLPAWSPDGTRLAFESQRDGLAEEIYVMNADGSTQINLTNHPASDIEPAWSPDGTKIAFRSNRDGDYEIFVMNADSSGQTQLTFNTGNEQRPTWSPDSARIAYNARPLPTMGNYEIWIIPAAGGTPQQLTDAAGELPPRLVAERVENRLRQYPRRRGWRDLRHGR